MGRNSLAESKEKTLEKEQENLSEWVLLAQEGNQRGYSKIIDLTQNKIYKFLTYRCRSNEDAEELCQETYIKAFKSISSLSEPEKLLGWLFKIAHNTFLNSKRKKRVDTFGVEQNHLDNLKSTGGDKESTIHIRQVFNMLSEDGQNVIHLIDIGGMSYNEAAEVIGISEGALRSRLARAREEFETIWKEVEKKVA